jgi:hypothetical protein
MKVVAFLTDYAVVDRIISHLKLTFATERPHPSRFFVEVALITLKNYFSQSFYEEPFDEDPWGEVEPSNFVFY